MDVILQDPYPAVEFFFGVLALVLIIFIHGIGVRQITRVFSNRWARITPKASAWNVNMLFALVIAALATLHLFETLVFALAISAVGLLPSLRDSYFYVMGNYTTLGAGTVHIPAGWRLAGPIIGMAGLFTFGWTSSLLVSVMSDISRLDRAKAVTEARRETAEETPDAEF